MCLKHIFLGGRQRKTKEPRSILLQEITSLIFSVSDSRKGATWEKEVKQRDLEPPTRWILPNSNWRTVELIGVHLADKEKREQECLWGRCKHEVAPLNVGGQSFQWPTMGAGGTEWSVCMCVRVCVTNSARCFSAERHLYSEEEAVSDTKLNSGSGQ